MDSSAAEAQDLTDIYEAMEKLEGPPSEDCHWEADRLVVEALNRLGHRLLADSYERVGKWFA